MDKTLVDLESKVDGQSGVANEIVEAKMLMNALERDIEHLNREDFRDLTIDEIQTLLITRKNHFNAELKKLEFSSWGQFTEACSAYNFERDLDPLSPFSSMLSDVDLKRIKDEGFQAKYKWDKHDYLWVGISGLLAALSDYLLVCIPKVINIGQLTTHRASPLTQWLKRYDTSTKGGRTDWFATWCRELELRCKVPYDRVGAGMHPRTHRFQSLGHDPILGFVFGILDIMRGTITGFSYDHLNGLHSGFNTPIWSNLKPIYLIEAFLKQLGHLVSDVATPMGLPSPLMPVFQTLNFGNIGANDRTIAQVSRYMYRQGFDLRHFLVSGITPAVIEAILQAYMMLRHYQEYGDVQFRFAKGPKYRSMLLCAHSIAALGNAGKIAICQNFLAFNQAQWMALYRYLIPSIKYWVFDRQGLILEHMQTISDEGWDDLLDSSREILRISTQDEPVIELGSIAAR